MTLAPVHLAVSKAPAEIVYETVVWKCRSVWKPPHCPTEKPAKTGGSRVSGSQCPLLQNKPALSLFSAFEFSHMKLMNFLTAWSQYSHLMDFASCQVFVDIFHAWKLKESFSALTFFLRKRSCGTHSFWGVFAIWLFGCGRFKKRILLFFCFPWLFFQDAIVIVELKSCDMDIFAQIHFCWFHFELLLIF